MKSQGSNTAQLRDAIDRGRTGDKVRVLDPAASPLGTDDEAAGTPPRAAEADDALRHETSRVSRLAAAGTDTRQRPSSAMYAGQAQRRRNSPIAIGLGIVVAAAIAYALIRMLGA